MSERAADTPVPPPAAERPRGDLSAAAGILWAAALSSPVWAALFVWWLLS